MEVSGTWDRCRRPRSSTWCSWTCSREWRSRRAEWSCPTEPLDWPKRKTECCRSRLEVTTSSSHQLWFMDSKFLSRVFKWIDARYLWQDRINSHQGPGLRLDIWNFALNVGMTLWDLYYEILRIPILRKKLYKCREIHKTILSMTYLI